MRVREYVGPLRVLIAAVIGFSLLCSVSALAMNDLNSQNHTTLEPLNLVEMAIDNIGTSAALTQQAVTAFVPTPTVVPTHTASLTPLSSATATALPSLTPRKPTQTHRPRSTIAAIFPPTRTRVKLPTATKTPIPTNTPVPPTDTPIPDTATPAPTATSIPDTATPVPPTEPPTNIPDPPTEAPTPTESSGQVSDPTQVVSP